MRLFGLSCPHPFGAVHITHVQNRLTAMDGGNARILTGSVFARRFCRTWSSFKPNQPNKKTRISGFFCLARLERFELPTARFVAEYSIQLSYRRINCYPELQGRTPRGASSNCHLQFSGRALSVFADTASINNGGERGIRTLDRAINPIHP